MRLPSIRAAWDEAQRTQSRFPFVLLAAALATASGWIGIGSSSNDSVWVAVMVASTLGFSLLTAVAVASERLGSRTASLILQGAALATLIGFGWAWHGWSSAIQARRYAQFSLGFHLLVAFLPYLGVREANGFWQYNRILFLRFCLSAVYSGVLYTGLVVALVAIDQLFKVHMAGSVYMRLWLAIAFVFNTWFFLAGVPRDLRALEERRDYPRGLKVFTQFILLPLVVIYLLILTTYLGRILNTGQWPSGWIGYLVSSVAAVGILSLLLVHPIREQHENRWVGTYARWFYVALLPSIGMLLVAIGKRIQQYGITEDRFFVAVLALWLAGVSAWYVARRNAGIRAIPVTLCLLAFLTAFGPLGAYTVSRRSQAARVRGLLARAQASPSGAPRTASQEVSHATRRELSSTLAYLIGTHGDRSLRGVLDDEVLAAAGRTGDRTAHGRDQMRAKEIMDHLGLEYVAPGQAEQSRYFSYFDRGGSKAEATPISGVDYHVRLGGPPPLPFTADGAAWTLGGNRGGRVLSLVRDGETALEFSADTLVAFARAYGPASDTIPRPRLVANSTGTRALLTLRSYSGFHERDSTSFTNLDGDLYLTVDPSLSR